MKHGKKLLTAILTAALLLNGTVTAYAAYGETAPSDEAAAVAEVFYESHAIATTTNRKEKWNFNGGSWREEKELFPVYEGLEWPVKITCGYEEVLWIKNDYITKVGGTATGYRACGLVSNDMDTQYTKWIEPTKLSGKVTVTHKEDLVTYGVKIHFGD